MYFILMTTGKHFNDPSSRSFVYMFLQRYRTLLATDGGHKTEYNCTIKYMDGFYSKRENVRNSDWTNMEEEQRRAWIFNSSAGVP